MEKEIIVINLEARLVGSLRAISYSICENNVHITSVDGTGVRFPVDSVVIMELNIDKDGEVNKNRPFVKAKQFGERTHFLPLNDCWYYIAEKESKC